MKVYLTVQPDEYNDGVTTTFKGSDGKAYVVTKDDDEGDWVAMDEKKYWKGVVGRGKTEEAAAQALQDYLEGKKTGGTGKPTTHTRVVSREKRGNAPVSAGNRSAATRARQAAAKPADKPAAKPDSEASIKASDLKAGDTVSVAAWIYYGSHSKIPKGSPDTVDATVVSTQGYTEGRVSNDGIRGAGRATRVMSITFEGPDGQPKKFSVAPHALIGKRAAKPVADPREKDYGPVNVGDRVLINSPGGRSGSAKANAHGKQGEVTKAGPKNLTVRLDDGSTIQVSRGLVKKNNSGTNSIKEPGPKKSPEEIAAAATDSNLRNLSQRRSTPEPLRRAVDAEIVRRSRAARSRAMSRSGGLTTREGDAAVWRHLTDWYAAMERRTCPPLAEQSGGAS